MNTNPTALNSVPTFILVEPVRKDGYTLRSVEPNTDMAAEIHASNNRAAEGSGCALVIRPRQVGTEQYNDLDMFRQCSAWLAECAEVYRLACNAVHDNSQDAISLAVRLRAAQFGMTLEDVADTAGMLQRAEHAARVKWFMAKLFGNRVWKVEDFEPLCTALDFRTPWHMFDYAAHLVGTPVEHYGALRG